jgi:F-type H+-transporting ATPase subunit epsilon
MTTQTFNLVIVTPETTLYEGEVTKLICPGIHQEIAILPNHTPLYAQLLKGELVITETDHKQKTIPIDGGVIRVKLNQASIIVGFGENQLMQS